MDSKCYIPHTRISACHGVASGRLLLVNYVHICTAPANPQTSIRIRINPVLLVFLLVLFCGVVMAIYLRNSVIKMVLMVKVLTLCGSEIVLVRTKLICGEGTGLARKMFRSMSSCDQRHGGRQI